MSHVRSLGFEALEGRQLLSSAKAAKPQTAPAAVAGPLVLNGTLTVDEKDVGETTNADGSTTMSVPVAGRLGTLGKFRGLWNETVDSLGDIAAPDVLRLRNSKGGLIIEFNNEVPGKAHKIARGSFYYEHAQALDLGTGAYADATETGAIEVNTSAAKNEVVSMTLISTNT